MTSIRLAHVLSPAALFFASTSPLTCFAQDQRCIEIAPDGFTTAGACPEVGDASTSSAKLAGVPYGATPDWQNTLRRQVSSLYIADVDGDGDNDVVVGCYTSQSFPPYDDWHNMIYRNVGGQLEANPSWISSDQVHTADVIVADINHDGFMDVFSANGNFAASVIYFGAPGGPSTVPGWISAGPSTWTTSAAVFDFNHDGFLDVLTTNQGVSPDPYRPMYLFRNNNGALENSPSWQSAESSIQNGLAVADLDGDGWEDVAVAKWVNFSSAAYKNLNGTLQTTPYWNTGITSGTDKGAAIADVNGDGRPDILFGGNSSSANTTLYTQNQNGTFTPAWSSQAASPSAQDVRLQDVNGDGRPDVAEIHFSTGRCHIYLNNNGNFNFQPDWTYDASPVGTALAFGDINGDGCPDLVIGYSGQPSVVVFYNNNCARPCPADVNGDHQVNVSDLLTVINGWGACPAPPATCGADIAPAGGDGQVNVSDLLAVINGWGACPP